MGHSWDTYPQILAKNQNSQQKSKSRKSLDFVVAGNSN